ncbi:hypothetical protein OG978_44275 (plasmid) [Streptomyces sp. NBC_01591]|nr:hypothetical protein [Streptomyces sp. NBC_01591]WSD74142.1 hypothetical protein OG978_44275 [Streptomyces sp. NBC_01591]
MELPERVVVLSDAACEVWEGVVAGGWSAESGEARLGWAPALRALETPR